MNRGLRNRSSGTVDCGRNDEICPGYGRFLGWRGFGVRRWSRRLRSCSGCINGWRGGWMCRVTGDLLLEMGETLFEAAGEVE